MNYAWPIAFAFAAMCAAIAYANVHMPAAKDPQVACIEARGEWVPATWGGMHHGTCRFSKEASR